MIVDEHWAVHPDILESTATGWRRMIRVENTGGGVEALSEIMDYQPSRVIYAEGDSWFDKFTPLPATGTNLLDALRTPFHAVVLDVAHIGDTAANMVRGQQARQTRALFRLQDFDAILLSAGGNDLKDVFIGLFDRFFETGTPKSELDSAEFSQAIVDSVKNVVANVENFLALRDECRRDKTRAAPIFIHGYDYIQPRPAPARVFAGTRLGVGPWVYPAMRDAGLTDAEMRAVANRVINQLNEEMRARFADDDNVFFLDQRGLLEPAPGGSTGKTGHWLDEIHPNSDGFVRLARHRWDVALARKLGWEPRPGELVAAAAGHIAA